LRPIRSLLRVLKSRPDFEQAMTEELQFHIDQYTDDLIRSGLPAREARRRARIEFGCLNTVQENCREARGLRPFDELVRQLRHAVRLLRKTPGFTVTALVTLAVCIGANLTIFAVVDSILLRPLPFPDAGRLVTVFNTYPKAGVDRDGSSITNYYERRTRIPAFASLSLYSFGTAVVGEAGATQREPIARVSPEFFSTLGSPPVMGRSFTEEETSFQNDKAAILTDAYWREHTGADRNVIGRQLRVNGLPITVVGVLPAGFRLLSSGTRIYFPFSSRPEDRAPAERHSGGNSKHLIGRLKPGATVAQAQAQIDAQNTALEVDDPRARMMAEAGFRSIVTPLHADHVAGIRPALFWMQAGALMLLLIGAVNLTNLLLIRAGSRVKELAVRQALGASRWHVVSETIVETTLLTLAGGVLGLVAGTGGIRLLTALGADRLPLGSQIAFDARLAAVALLGSVAMGLGLALPIAWFNLREHRSRAIRSESRGSTTGRAAQCLRHCFVVAQIALGLVLLAAATFLGSSLQRAMSVSPGFRPDHVLTGQISVPWNNYPNWTARLAFNEKLLKDLVRLPGVTAAGIVNNVPLSGNIGKSAAGVKGHVRLPGESPRGHYAYGVDGDYFAALGFSLRSGRFLSADDSRRSTPRVCVVDEDFARFYWPRTSSLGQQLFLGSGTEENAQAFTIAGVVGAVKQAGLTEQTAQGAVYYPYALRTDDNLFVVVRTSLAPHTLALQLQTLVRSIDPELPVNDIRSMDDRIAESLLPQRSPALIGGIFSFIAVLLIAVGTYGVLSYAVAQRRREIAVRMALGARPEQILSQFLVLALRLLTAGTILGATGAGLAGQAMRTMLFQAPSVQLPAVAGAAAVISAVALAACLLPSRRASHISPAEALAEL
jgi:predicted permease